MNVGDILKNPGIPGLKYGPDTKFGTVLTDFLGIVFLLATFLTFFWLTWGAFQYMSAGGDKQKLSEAKSRITWAIVGLIIVFVAFLVAQFVADVLQPRGGTPLGLVRTAHAVDLSQEYPFGNIRSLGEGVRLLVVPTFSIAAVVVIAFFIIGGIKYMTSGGEKEAVSSARSMITHAIIGFIILMMLFALMQFLSETKPFGFPDIIGR